jgi:hypothetical protein
MTMRCTRPVHEFCHQSITRCAGQLWRTAGEGDPDRAGPARGQHHQGRYHRLGRGGAREGRRVPLPRRRRAGAPDGVRPAHPADGGPGAGHHLLPEMTILLSVLHRLRGLCFVSPAIFSSRIMWLYVNITHTVKPHSSGWAMSQNTRGTDPGSPSRDCFLFTATAHMAAAFSVSVRKWQVGTGQLLFFFSPCVCCWLSLDKTVDCFPANLVFN